MRSIKKKMKVRQVEARVYDTKDKLEKLIESQVSEVEKRHTNPRRVCFNFGNNIE